MSTGFRNVDISFQDSLYMSEFAELRTAHPGNRSDTEFIYDKQPLLFDDISTVSGTATHQGTSRDIILATNASITGSMGGIRQHYWTPYTPGSGQEIDITGTLDEAGVGAGGTLSYFLRSTVSGTSTSLVEYPQSGWSNLTSGIDVGKSLIFRMSFQSLKVGRIQFSIVRNGVPMKVGEITNDNIRKTGYWQYASLPPYWRIYNNASNTVAEFGYGDNFNGIGFRYTFNGIVPTATARAICETVKSQGGVELYDMHGFRFATPRMTATPITVSTTLVPVLSIRLASTFMGFTNRTMAMPDGYSLDTTNPIDYVLLFRPTLTGAVWAAVDAAYSGMEYDITASAVTGGIIVDGDFLGAGINARISSTGVLDRIIMSLGNNNSDILTIAAIRSATNNASVKAVFKWREIR